MDETRARIAHLLRRTGFGPHPGQVDALVGGGVKGALEAVLAAPPLQPPPAELGTKDDYGQLLRWWVGVLSRPDAGLHEKMVWFWHGHLTSSIEKASPLAMWRQHQLLRTHALGNFRTLLQQITVDAAMLAWLDGDGSVAEAPNENYSREVMELFALGHDAGYTEADVHAGAVALSGWFIDDKTEKVAFDADSGPTAPVTFLGRSVREAADVIDAICDHEACAPHIAGTVYRWFHGVAPDAPTLGTLASVFRDAKLEILPLVAAVLRDPAFLERRNNRPRLPIEWFVAANALLGVTEPDDLDVLEQLGQEPFSPPNVAGWPIGPRWQSASASMSRAAYAWDASDDSETVSTSDPVADILAKASLFETTDETVAALRQAVASVEGRRDRASVLHALAVTCPEFCVA
jgi:uncharacterized protein (DUF1800 family)